MQIPDNMNITKTLLLILILFSGCSTIRSINEIPNVILGEASFYPTLAAHTDASIIAGNRVELLLNGEQIFPALLQAIRGARTSITYAQYLYEGGSIAYEIAEALAERCRAGVQVKILLDSLGAGPIPAEIPARWKSAGCQLEWFRPVKVLQFITPWDLFRYNHRSHRRILVIDGTIGFTGGHGVSEAWTGNGRTAEHWRQTDVKVEGPIVQQLQAAFAESWRETTGNLLGDDSFFPALDTRGKVSTQVVKSSPLNGSFGSYLLFLVSITSAQKSIHIANPYFLPDARITLELINAVKRGVRVVILTPGIGDHMTVYAASRGGFGPFLLGGVEIYEYQPALMHTKAMVVDGVWASVGSANLDSRSLGINEEVNLVVYDATFAKQLEQSFQEDLQHAIRLTHEAWSARPVSEKILELIMLPGKNQM